MKKKEACSIQQIHFKCSETIQTPMTFTTWAMDQEDEYCERVPTKVIAGLDQVTLCVDGKASVEKVIRIFQRRPPRL
jgi:hypothetical protein